MYIVDQLISETVNGKTFLDVGPLWEIVNEKISIADHFGASAVTAIDQFPKTDLLWTSFSNRLKHAGVTNCTSLSMNILDYEGNTFDVVNCGGVIYHAPDPMHLLKKLRKIVKERLILTSTVTPQTISNEQGEFTMPDGAVVFVPALSDKNKKIISTHWSYFLKGRAGGNLVNNFDWDANNYYDWWWLFTPPVLNAMCTSCGFTIDKIHTEFDLHTISMH